MNTMQVGKFSVSAMLVKTNPDMIADALALARVLIVRAEYLFAQDAIEYEAICDQFAEKQPGTRPPEYGLIIRTDDSVKVDGVTFTPLTRTE